MNAFTDTLREILDALSCETGTIHEKTEDGQNLSLICQIGVPDFLLERISHIAWGKGIAGAAAASGTAIELCNLQEDTSGVAKPAARQTGVSGSIAVPIFSPEDGSTVIGTLGVGMREPHEFTAAEKAQLTAYAQEIATRI